MLSRTIILLTAFVVSGQTLAFSSNFTLFTDSSITNTDAGADGLWHNCNDAVNNVNPAGAVSYIYQSDTGAFNVGAYEGFLVGDFTLETPDSDGATTAQYTAVNLTGYTPSAVGPLPYQVGSLSLATSPASNIAYNDVNNTTFSSGLNLQSLSGSTVSFSGQGFTLYNAEGLNDPNIFGPVFGSDPFYDNLSQHFDYLLGLAPEDWTAITVDFLDLGDELSVILSSYSLDENLLPDSAAAVPLPPAVWLLGTALIGLINCPRKKTSI